MRFRRAMMVLASAGGNRVPVIAKLVQADEDTVRDVLQRFNEIGLACLDPPAGAGGGADAERAELVGAIALELDRNARITGLTALWGGTLISDAAMTTLLAATIER